MEFLIYLLIVAIITGIGTAILRNTEDRYGSKRDIEEAIGGSFIIGIAFPLTIPALISYLSVLKVIKVLNNRRIKNESK